MRYISIITLLLMLTQTGCQSSAQKMGEKRSTFFRNLDFVKVANRASPGGISCHLVSPALGGQAYGGNPESIVEWFNVICESKEAASFAEATFMSALKAELEKEINQAGVSALGQNEYEGYICLEYRTSNNHGWIEVICRRAEGESYKLLCVKRELGWG